MSCTGFDQLLNIEAKCRLGSTIDGGHNVSGGCKCSMRGNGGQNEYGCGVGMRWVIFFLSHLESISQWWEEILHPPLVVQQFLQLLFKHSVFTPFVQVVIAHCLYAIVTSWEERQTTYLWELASWNDKGRWAVGVALAPPWEDVMVSTPVALEVAINYDSTPQCTERMTYMNIKMPWHNLRGCRALNN